MDAMLIGLGHAARQGKDEVAKILVRDHGFVRVAFADALKAVAYDSNHRVRRLVDTHGWEEAKATPSVRKYLVDLGNACRNHVWSEVWIDAVFRHMDPTVDYVIADVRYPNEVKRVVDEYGIAVKVTRPGVEPLDNVADHALLGFTGWTAEIVNDGTLADLRIKVADLMRHHTLDIPTQSDIS